MTPELIKPEWVNVSPLGEGNQLRGTMPRNDNLGECASIFEATQPVIPRGEWKQIIEEQKPSLRDDVAKIKNQLNEGSCTANAGTQGWEMVFNDTMGKEAWVELSPISLYKRTGRSPNSGSTVGDNVRELRDTGALPTHAMKAKLTTMGLDPSHTMPETGFYTQFPSGWKETAKYFRLGEYFDIRGIEGFFSALLSGFAVHYGRAGHSIVGVEATWRQNAFYCVYANSWGNWGDQGFGYDSESYIKNAINQYGAYAYRTTVKYDCFEKLRSTPLPNPS